MKKIALLGMMGLSILFGCSKKDSNQAATGSWYTSSNESSSSTSSSSQTESNEEVTGNNSIYDIVLEKLRNDTSDTPATHSLIMILMGMVRMNYFLDGTGSLREQLNLRLFIMIITE